MKLLFDENLSPRLSDVLRTEFPGSSHIRDVGLLGADDGAVWLHARRDHFAIVSKDNDFRQRSFLLRREHARILAFEADPESSLLVLVL